MALPPTAAPARSAAWWPSGSRGLFVWQGRPDQRGEIHRGGPDGLQYGFSVRLLGQLENCGSTL
jgi:hypothetical protein